MRATDSLIGKAVVLDTEAVVVFDDGGRDVVGLQKLLMLKPHNDIVMKLIRNWNIPTEDFQAAIKICNRYRNGSSNDALELSLANENIRKICTVNCKVWLSQQDRKLSQGKRSRQ